MSKKVNAEAVERLLASIEDARDVALDSDVHLANRLQRIASNVAVAFADNDLLIESLNVDAATRSQIASIIKEAVSKRVRSKKTKPKVE